MNVLVFILKLVSSLTAMKTDDESATEDIMETIKARKGFKATISARDLEAAMTLLQLRYGELEIVMPQALRSQVEDTSKDKPVAVSGTAMPVTRVTCGSSSIPNRVKSYFNVAAPILLTHEQYEDIMKYGHSSKMTVPPPDIADSVVSSTSEISPKKARPVMCDKSTQTEYKEVERLQAGLKKLQSHMTRFITRMGCEDLGLLDYDWENYRTL